MYRQTNRIGLILAVAALVCIVLGQEAFARSCPLKKKAKDCPVIKAAKKIGISNSKIKKIAGKFF